MSRDVNDALPIEIAFLTAYGVDRAVLRQVAARARLSGVPADRALLAEGLMSAHRFYEILAHYLGVVYLHQPLPIAGGLRLDQAMKVEIVPLAPNALGLRYVLAPKGEVLAAMLRRFEQDRRPGTAKVAITSPQRLAALVRLHHRRTIVQEASHGLADWNDNLSARGGWSFEQRLSGVCFAAVAVLGAALWPEVTFALLCLMLSLLFLGMVAVRLLAAARSREGLAEPMPRSADDKLPVYTILVPLYRETRIVPRLVRALRALDYPPGRLDIKMVVEADDPDTLDALQAERLPDCFEVLIAPPAQPQTKPRALNVALQFARGQYLVVYDAEDEPEPDQLRMAAGRFANAPGSLACLQARLVIDNSDDSWITRLFALEYAALFDVVNPGLARLGLPIALGGTSNHFRLDALRRVNGWDAWNVTEDIDLGIRLARFGYRVGVLRSSTFEEAPNRLGSWLGQRRRWQKGWMVTLQTHSKNPTRLFTDLGAAGGSAVFAILCGTLVSALFGPLFTLGVVYEAVFGPLLAPHTPSEWAWSLLAGVLIVSGLISATLPLSIGMRRRGLTALAGYVILLPLYLLLLSLATWQALFEMLRRPHVWAKTEHGLAKRRVRPRR